MPTLSKVWHTNVLADVAADVALDALDMIMPAHVADRITLTLTVRASRLHDVEGWPQIQQRARVRPRL